MVRQILVVKKEILFPEKIFEGFIPFSKELMEKILRNYDYMERNDELENNPSFLQIIPYAWILNIAEKKAFIYKRGLSKGDYKEKRHVEKYSGGIGGHIDKEEVEPANPIVHALEREMREEVTIVNYPDFRFVGFVHREDDIYERVHLGVVAVAETEEEVSATDDGLNGGSFMSILEIEELMSRDDVEFDKWTKTSWPFIKKLLN